MIIPCRFAPNPAAGRLWRQRRVSSGTNRTKAQQGWRPNPDLASKKRVTPCHVAPPPPAGQCRGRWHGWGLDGRAGRDCASPWRARGRGFQCPLAFGARCDGGTGPGGGIYFYISGPAGALADEHSQGSAARAPSRGIGVSLTQPEWRLELRLTRWQSWASLWQERATASIGPAANRTKTCNRFCLRT